jgi:mannose-6-phosphate isomerase-like protein (cupin superfamily)
MQPRYFLDLEEAIWYFVKNHKMHPCYPHRIAAGETIEPHHHRQADEWLCIRGGNFILRLGDEEKPWDLRHNRFYACFRIPKGKRHAIKALTNLQYFIFRNRMDRSVYERKGGR